MCFGSSTPPPPPRRPVRMYNHHFHRPNMYREHPGWYSAYLSNLRRSIDQLFVEANWERQRADARTPTYKYNLRSSSSAHIRATCEHTIRRNSRELAHCRNALRDTKGRAERLRSDARYARARGFSPYGPPVGALAGSQTMMGKYEMLKGGLEGLVLALRNVSR